jgi:DNA-directed RNA polymerase subunit beta
LNGEGAEIRVGDTDEEAYRAQEILGINLSRHEKGEDEDDVRAPQTARV